MKNTIDMQRERLQERTQEIYDAVFARMLLRTFVTGFAEKPVGVGRSRVVKAERGNYGTAELTVIAHDYDRGGESKTLARRSVGIRELRPGKMRDLSLPVTLAETEFGVDFVLHPTGRVPLLCRVPRDFEER